MSNSIAQRFGMNARTARPARARRTTRTTTAVSTGAGATPKTPIRSPRRTGARSKAGVNGVAAATPPAPPVVLAASPSTRRQTDVGLLEIGWDRRPLGPVICLDTETEAIDKSDKTKIPRLALLVAHDSERTLIVPPAGAAEFLAAHHDREWVFHNAAFDFWVLHENVTDPRLKTLLFDMVGEGRLHDTMLLDQLIRLATDGGDIRARNLQELAAMCQVAVPLDKDADAAYRLNYHELLGVELARVEDDGWFIYPAKDVQAGYGVFTRLVSDGLALLQGPLAEFLPPEASDWGLLSEPIQVQGAIALAALERTGLHIDQAYQAALHAKLQTNAAAQATQINNLISHDPLLASRLGGQKLFRANGKGAFIRTPTGGICKSIDVLHQALSAVMDAIAAATGKRPVIPTTAKSGKITTAADVWSDHRGAHPFVDAWLQLEQTTKVIQFTSNGASVAHPSYGVITRTGRTSCSNPNLQNIPRSGGVREMWVPSAGQVFLAADYSQIELRALAHICRRVVGFSHLGDVFAAGKDPHVHTAAAVLGITPEQLLQCPDHKEKRQAAKAINFGVGGGMGGSSLADYARLNYGVVMSVEEAKQFRQKLIYDVYPELGEYLRDDALAHLARNLHISMGECKGALGITWSQNPASAAHRVRRIIFGETCDWLGEPYSHQEIAKVWDQLRCICRNPEFTALIQRGHGDPLVGAKLFASTACTLTGRARAGCSFTQSKNCPFQALAADGAKLALFELVRRGWRVVAFIHDEVLTEIPVGCDYDAKAGELIDVMVSAMSRVCPSVPIECGEPVLMTRWSKDAGTVRDAQRRLVPWSP